MRIINFSKKILLAALVACTFIGCAIAFNGKVAKAADKITDEATIVVEEYPSLKINADGGMRFVIKMNAAAKNYLIANDDISLIAYIGPIKLFEKSDDDIKSNAIKCSLDKGKFYQITGDDNWYANACVIKTKAANRAVDYTVKAFVEKTDGTVIKTFAASENARGNVYNIATRALLDSSANYTEAILAIENYDWLGSEEFPVRINTIERYNELVAKINGGANLADKYVEIRSTVNTEAGAALSDGKTLPKNNYKVSYVTFASETGETLAEVKVKNGAAAAYNGEVPTKADDDDYAYSFDKWVTTKGGDVAADLTNISGDTTVYASFKAKGKNSITEFAVADINYGETPSFTATAKNGTPEVKYSKTEDGIFVDWAQLENRDAGVYYAKASVIGTDAYAGAEVVKQFNVKKLTDNAITFNVVGEVACNGKFEPTATAAYGTAKVLYAEAQDGEFKEITSSVVFEKGKTYYVKAAVDGTVNYNGAETEIKSVLFKDHSYNENGKCTVCNDYNTQGVQYAYDENKGCYYVADNTTLNVAEVTILPAYADDTHGEKAVKYVAFGAFKGNGNITKVVLPESVTDLYGGVFLGCNNLTYVSMIGVSEMYATDGEKTGGRWGDNNFRNCNKLSTVIVNSGFTVTCGQFNAENLPETLILNLFVDGASGTVKIEGNNALWTGNVFYKGDGDKCGQWSYISISDDSIKYTSHNFVDGICQNCGAYSEEKTQGVQYVYDKDKDCYYVGNNTTLNVAEVTILSAYNDGTHGEKAVKYVASGAFRDNNNVTKVVLPESVDSLEGNAFWGCGNLEYVSMTGVTGLNFTSPYGGTGRNNNFRNCFKLKTVIVSTSLKTNVGQFGAAVGEVKEKILDFFVDGESGAPDLYTGAPDANNLVSGRVFYKGDGDKCGQWSYNSDESIKYTSHNYVDGACEKCGESQSKSVTYAYDQTSKSYYVTGVEAGTAETELYIRAKYNDGTNGDAAVTFVKHGAFSGNVNIKKVVLPATITTLDGRSFAYCTNLEYISMIGVKALQAAKQDRDIYSGEEMYTTQNFLDCKSLKTIIVGAEFADNGQQFTAHQEKIVEVGNIYTTAATADGIKLSDNCPFLTKNVYLFSESKPGDTEHTYWHYVGGVATLWA